jgi:hypothetical protein
MPELLLLGGLVVLGGVLLLGYLFVNANPARLARSLKWTGLALAIAAGLGLLVATRGRVVFWLAPLLAILPTLRRFRSLFGGGRGPSTGPVSTVETPLIRMTLDHATGDMTGTVLQGQFAGLHLHELSRTQLLDLLRECRAGDEEGARLVEAYLDRGDPNWRDDLHAAGGGDAGGSRPRPAAPDVTVEEAYAILGLAPGADAEAIKAAYHRLMMQLHPDHGGSDYFAAKLNRARDVLLHR